MDAAPRLRGLLAAASEAWMPPGALHIEPREIASTAWAVARLPIADVPLLDSLAAAAIRPIGHFTPQDLGRTAWAFSRLQSADEPLRDALSA